MECVPHNTLAVPEVGQDGSLTAAKPPRAVHATVAAPESSPVGDTVVARVLLELAVAKHDRALLRPSTRVYLACVQVIQARTRGWLTRRRSCRRWASLDHPLSVGDRLLLQGLTPQHLNPALMAVDRLCKVRAATIRVQSSTRGWLARSRWASYKPYQPPPSFLNPALRPVGPRMRAPLRCDSWLEGALHVYAAASRVQAQAHGWFVRSRSQREPYEPYWPPPKHREIDHTQQTTSIFVLGSARPPGRVQVRAVCDTGTLTLPDGGQSATLVAGYLNADWGGQQHQSYGTQLAYSSQLDRSQLEGSQLDSLRLGRSQLDSSRLDGTLLASAAVPTRSLTTSLIGQSALPSSGQGGQRAAPNGSPPSAQGGRADKSYLPQVTMQSRLSADGRRGTDWGGQQHTTVSLYLFTHLLSSQLKGTQLRLPHLHMAQLVCLRLVWLSHLRLARLPNPRLARLGKPTLGVTTRPALACAAHDAHVASPHDMRVHMECDAPAASPHDMCERMAHDAHDASPHDMHERMAHNAPAASPHDMHERMAHSAHVASPHDMHECVVHDAHVTVPYDMHVYVIRDAHVTYSSHSRLIGAWLDVTRLECTQQCTHSS